MRRFYHSVGTWLDSTLRGRIRCSVEETTRLDQVGKECATFFSTDPSVSSNVQVPPPKAKKLNDSLYELYKPELDPELEIVFFHGIQLRNYKDAYLRTWMSLDDSQCWLQTWLSEEFPRARILSVSYDASVSKCKNRGRLDLTSIGEILMNDVVVLGKVGQSWSCPLVLVGHCLGGLIIKQLCIEAEKQMGRSMIPSHRERCSRFLNNMRGIFYFATPHGGTREFKGSRLIKFAGNCFYNRGPVMEYMQLLSTATERLNNEFRQWQLTHDWKAAAVAETFETKVGLFHNLVVEEPSSRRDIDCGHYIAVPADHFTVCKPEDKLSSSFLFLTTFVRNILEEGTDHPYSQEDTPVSMVDIVLRTEIVMDKLKNATSLGLVGMGGVGKTTLAREVFKKLYEKFEYTCFIQDVQEIFKSSKDGHAKLEICMTSCLRRAGRKIINREGLNWRALKGKQLLLVLDDVDSEKQLEGVLKLFGSDEGSRVLATSRDQRVFQGFDCVYEVDVLSFDKACELFKQCAFKDQDMAASTVKPSLVEKIVNQCGRLPLALEVVGSYLNAGGVWKDVVKRLGDAEGLDGNKDDRLWVSLRMTLDALAPEEMEMFLDAATLFVGTSYDYNSVGRALAIWTACGRSAEIGLKNLERRRLIRVHNKRLDMHVLVRNLGRSIACPKDQNADVWTRLSREDQVEELLDLLAMHPGIIPKVQGLMIAGTASKVQKVPGDFFFRMPHLRMLFLKDVEASGTVQLPRLLQVLEWQNGHVTEFPSDLSHLKQLRRLRLRNWSNLRNMSKGFENLSNLQSLEIEDCLALQDLGLEFGQLKSLQQVILRNTNLKTLPESIGQLEKLKSLDVRGTSLTMLPFSFGNLQRLKELDFQDARLTILPQSFGQLSLLTTLDLRFNPLTSLPEFIGNLGSLTCLRLQGTSLCSLPDSFASLVKLEVLDLGGTRLTDLPDKFGALVHLRILDLQCTSLRMLPESFMGLCALERLDMSCENLTSLPNQFGELVNLRVLSLQGCPVSVLPESLGKLQRLELLNLSETSLIALPASFGQLSLLKELLLIDCQWLQTLPDSWACLVSLREIDMTNCAQIEYLPESFGDLPALEFLSLLNCKGLVSLPASFSRLSSLRELKIAPGLSCHDEGLRKFWESQGELTLSNLKEIDRSILETLEYRQICGLLAIAELQIRQDPPMNVLLKVAQLSAFSDVSKFIEREVDDLSTVTNNELWQAIEQHNCVFSNHPLCVPCGDSNAFSEWGSRFHALAVLYSPPLVELAQLLGTPAFWSIRNFILSRDFVGLHGVNDLVVHLQELLADRRNEMVSKIMVSYLEDLSWFSILRKDDPYYSMGNVLRLPALCCVLDVMWKFDHTVQNLKVAETPAITSFPSRLARLQSLEYLELHDTHNFQVLPQQLLYAIAQAPRLYRLGLFNFNTLKTFPDNLWQCLSKIQKVEVTHAKSLMNLPDSFIHMSSLWFLTLDNLPELESLPESFGQLPALSSLFLKNCASLQKLPHSFCQLPALQTLLISCCPKLCRLPPSFKDFKILSNFHMDSCSLYEELVGAGLGYRPDLKVYFKSTCHNIHNMPLPMGIVEAVAYFHTISDCRHLQMPRLTSSANGTQFTTDIDEILTSCSTPGATLDALALVIEELNLVGLNENFQCGKIIDAGSNLIAFSKLFLAEHDESTVYDDFRTQHTELFMIAALSAYYKRISAHRLSTQQQEVISESLAKLDGRLKQVKKHLLPQNVLWLMVRLFLIIDTSYGISSQKLLTEQQQDLLGKVSVAFLTFECHMHWLHSEARQELMETLTPLGTKLRHIFENVASLTPELRHEVVDATSKLLRFTGHMAGAATTALEQIAAEFAVHLSHAMESTSVFHAPLDQPVVTEMIEAHRNFIYFFKVLSVVLEPHLQQPVAMLSGELDRYFKEMERSIQIRSNELLLSELVQEIAVVYLKLVTCIFQSPRFLSIAIHASDEFMFMTSFIQFSPHLEKFPIQQQEEFVQSATDFIEQVSIQRSAYLQQQQEEMVVVSVDSTPNIPSLTTSSARGDGYKILQLGQQQQHEQPDLALATDLALSVPAFPVSRPSGLETASSSSSSPPYFELTIICRGACGGTCTTKIQNVPDSVTKSFLKYAPKPRCRGHMTLESLRRHMKSTRPFGIWFRDESRGHDCPLEARYFQDQD